MNEKEVDERYRLLSDRDSSRPSEQIRRAVLRHAAELATQGRTLENPAPIEFRRPSANEPRWRVATYGGLAAAALAGLLIAPHFFTPSPAPMTRPSVSPAPSSEPAAEKPATPAPTPAVPRLDARRAPKAQRAARESASPPQLAQAQAMTAPSDARTTSSLALHAAAAPTTRTPDAATALREAAQSGNVQRVEALIAEGTDIDARDASGRSALMLAVLHDQKQAVSSLLAAGADPNAKDTSGTTPLAAAIAAARPEIAAALQRAGAR
jgi:hypothetical protein